MTPFRNQRGETFFIATDPTRDALLTDVGRATLEDRYLAPGETFQSMFARVAAFYSDDADMAQRVYDYISKHWFMPATPVLTNGGTDRGNPISCFLNAVQDSIESINNTWHENVWLAAKGGGIGTYWGGVRSMGEKVGEVGETSGVVPFLKVQDTLTSTISQGSLRRGSSAVYLDDRHPEIEEFIEIRKIGGGGDPRRKCLDVHHGVCLTDEFMHAVDKNKSWELRSPKDGSVRKVIKARELWQKILETRVQTGEPYIIFIDTVNRMRPEVYQRLGLKVRQSNLCSEIALHTGIDHLGNDRTAVCCLGSINDAKVDEWFGNRQFVKDVQVFLDNVLQDFIDRTEGMPGFEKARYSAMRERSIGCGQMGFHSMLQMKGLPFESALAKAWNIKISKWLKLVADEINVEVANERGPCPDAVDAGLNVRWSHMFSIAPTATISLIAGTTSAGTEPIPSNIYTAKTLSGSFQVKNTALDALLRRYAHQRFGEFVEVDGVLPQRAMDRWVDEVWKDIEKHEGSVQHLTTLTDDERKTFRTAFEIDQRWIIEHAAARAPWIDQMASNNLFLPADIHKKDLHNLHRKAWKDGVPSLYYVRSKSLQRADMASHMAGEMPQPHGERQFVLQPMEPLSAGSYEECLACQ